jgi:hypothetical protein
VTVERKTMVNGEHVTPEVEPNATSLPEATCSRQSSDELSGEVERISATVEHGGREQDLMERMTAVEHELAELKAAAGLTSANPLRRTIPASTSEMLAKHGIGEGPVDVRTLDAALAGLSLEQRIAVKTQLLRAGAIA